MKRPERLKLVEDIRARIYAVGAIPLRSQATYAMLLKQAADCITQLENELDKIHENFMKDQGLK